MKYIAILFSLFVLASCGKDETTIIHNVPEEVTEDLFLEGAFYLENNGFLEITQDSFNRVTLESSGQLILSVNPQNNTIAEHPRISIVDAFIINDKIFSSRNYNYTSGNDLEEDVSGANITGNRKTDITIEIVDNKLQIKIEIYAAAMNNNINFIVATRIIKEQ